MKTVTAVFASTQIDRQGEGIDEAALDSMAQRLSQHYLVMYMDHDPRTVPIGRVVAARVVPADETGEYKLVGEFELWEQGDTPDTLEGDGRAIYARCTDALEISLDEALLQGGLADDLRQAIGANGTISYRAKKAADLGSTIFISAGVFTLLQFATGFLNEAGADLYAAIKAALRKWRRTRPLEAVEVVVGVTMPERKVEVHCFLPEPTPDDIESFFTRGLNSIAGVAVHVIEKESRAVRIFLQWHNGSWNLHYWVREDGVPSRIEAVPIDALAGMGMSISAIVKLEDVVEGPAAS